MTSKRIMSDLGEWRGLVACGWISCGIMARKREWLFATDPSGRPYIL